MNTTLLLLALVAAPPEGNELALLKTFREEFVAVPADAKQFPKPFLIAKYEVPQNLWEAVMGSNPSKWKGKRNSVEMLSYGEAQDFCKRATERMREAKLIEPTQTVRLPTEAEWDYSTRAGTTTKYSFGDDADSLNDYAWSTHNAAGNDPPVGAKKSNPWGLHDVHGYLWEWCVGKVDKGEAVIRGGSWKDPADKLTSSSRRVVAADLRDDAVGLRCVLAD